MIFILNKQEKVINILKNNGGAEGASPFFNDIYTQDLATGAETFSFSSIAVDDVAKDLAVGNYVAFKDNDGKYKLFQIVQTEESHEDTMYISVYAEGAGLELINKIFRARKSPSTSLRKFMDLVLDETGWNVGFIPYSAQESFDLDLADATVYSTLQTNLSTYGVEMAFRVEINQGRVSSKYIDLYTTRGKVTGKRFTFGKDIEGIKRKVDSTELFTAMIGRGNNNTNFKDIVIDGIDKPLGQDFVVNQQAYDRYNNNGYHIMGMFRFDTNSPEELLRETNKRLNECKEPKIEYEVSVALLGDLLGETWNTVNLGDTVAIVDNSFNPPIHLMARVSKLEKSKTNPQADTCTLANFIEVKSNISDEMKNLASQLEGVIDSKFPIKSEDISDGAVGKDQISDLYTDALTVDILKAGEIITESLIAEEAKITNANIENAIITYADIVQATIGKLEAEIALIDTALIDKADITELNAVIANIKELNVEIANIGEAVIDKAGITELNAVIANIKELSANLATIDNLLAGNITADNIQAGSITAGSGIIAEGAIGSAEISELEANKITSGEIDTSKVKVTGENGFLFIENNTLFVVDDSRNIRCELGLIENNSNYGFIVRGADGQTILIDHTGVKNAGITDGAVDNRTVSENANINGKKLDINSVIKTINDDGTVKIQGTVVQIGNTTLDVKLTEQNNLITEHDKKLETQQADITANTNSIKLKVDNQIYESDKEELNSKMSKNTSAIEVLNNKIALKVESTDIENAINGIVVGGRNYVKDYKFQRTDIWLKYGTALIDTEDGCGVISTSKTPSYLNQDFKNKEFKKGDILTIQYEMKCEGIVAGEGTNNGETFFLRTMLTGYLNDNSYISDIAIFRRHEKDFNEFSDWKKVTETATITNTNFDYSRIRFYARNFTGKVKFRNIKLELGTKATDLSPAPEDTQTFIDDIKVGGRNLVTTSKQSESIEAFEYGLNKSIFQNKCTLETLKVNDTIMISFDVDYYNFVKIAGEGQNPRILLQGSGDVTGWDSGSMGQIVFTDSIDWVTKNGSARVIKEIKITSNHKKNNLWNMNFRIDHIKADGLTIKNFQIERGTKLTDWKPSPESVNGQVDGVYDHVNNVQQSVINSYESALEIAKENITLSVSQTYAKKDDLSSVEEILSSKIDQTAKDISFTFNKTTDEVKDDLQEFKEQVTTYIRFDADGMELGKQGSKFKTKLNNEKLAFLQDEEEVAYISNNKMYITDAEVTNQFTLGNYAFVPRANGNLSLKWIK